MAPVTDQPTPSFASTLNQASYAVGGSWTPPNGDMVYAMVVNSKASTPDTPTLSGNGQTWTQLSTLLYDTVATPTRRITWFYAFVSSPSAGVMTVAFGGVNQTGCLLTVFSASGLDTGGTNGVNSFRNIATNQSDVNSPTAAIAMAAFLTTNNPVVLGVGVTGTVTLVADAVQSGYTLGTQQGYTSPATTGGFEWRLASDTAPQITFSTNHWGAIGFELVAFPVLGVVFDAAVTSGSQVGTPYSYSITIANQLNRVVVVTVKMFAAGSVSSITHDGVALTHDVGSDIANGGFRTETWYLVAPATGTKTITVTLSGAIASVSDAVAYYNVHQTVAIEARATATGTGGSIGGVAAVSVTTLESGSMAVGSLVTAITSALTPQSIQNQRAETIPAVGGASLDDIGAILSPGATAFSWDFTGATTIWAASAVSVRATDTLFAQACL